MRFDPDVWSAALIYEMALADTMHPMRDVIVGNGVDCCIVALVQLSISHY